MKKHIDNTSHEPQYELEILSQRTEPGRRKNEYHWACRYGGTLEEMQTMQQNWNNKNREARIIMVTRTIYDPRSE